MRTVLFVALILEVTAMAAAVRIQIIRPLELKANSNSRDKYPELSKDFAFYKGGKPRRNLLAGSVMEDEGPMESYLFE